VLAVVVTFPLALQLTKSVYGPPGDGTGTIGIFWWWSYALRHGLNPLDNTFLGAPFGAGWDQLPFAVLPLLVFAPLSVLAGPTGAYNLGILASFPLTALFTYLLARRLGGKALPSTFAALAFAFAPYHVEKATGHLMHTHLELFAALLLFLVRWRQGGSRRNLLGAGCIMGLTLWTDYYYAFIMGVLLIIFFAVSVILSVDWGHAPVARLPSHVTGAMIVGIVAMAFVPAALFMGHRPSAGGYQQSLTGSVRGYTQPFSDLQNISLRPWEFLLPWHANPLVPEAVKAYELQHLHHSNFVEQSLFLGYTVVLLAVIGVFWSRRGFAVGLGIALVAGGVVFAQPPDVTWHGLRWIGPSHFLYRVVPYFRAYSRFGLLALLGAALLAGLGLTALQARMRGRAFVWMAVVAFLLLGLEFNNQPPTHTWTLFPAPAEYRWLQTQPAGILIEYPLLMQFDRNEIQTRQYVFYQQVHQHPLFNGAQIRSRADLVAPSLDPYYRPGVGDMLRTLGIRYVFVHRADYQADGYETPGTVAGFEFIGSFGDADVFRVIP
jgi:hypothetical protein